MEPLSCLSHFLYMHPKNAFLRPSPLSKNIPLTNFRGYFSKRRIKREFKLLSSSNPQVPHIIPCSSSSPFPATDLATHPFPAALQPTGRSSRATPQPGLGLHVHGHTYTPALAQERVVSEQKSWWDPANSIMWQLKLDLLTDMKRKNEVSPKAGPEHVLLLSASSLMMCLICHPVQCGEAEPYALWPLVNP